MPVKKILNLFAICLFVIFGEQAKAYDNKVVHKTINKSGIKQSQELLHSLNNYGFNNGIDDFVDGKKISKWFEDGGYEEDKPDTRSFNHFHDPTKSWDQAGLKFYAWLLIALVGAGPYERAARVSGA
jgi:hypothetical protein